MPYVSRKKYKSRREKHESTTRRLMIIIVTALILGAVLVLLNWTYIKDYVVTSFY